MLSAYEDDKSNPVDLRALQYSSLQKILSLNKPAKTIEPTEDDPYVWKILIFDQFCQESLSTLVKVGNLRDENVTLHLNIQTQRDKIHGVNTIYYVQPTPENIDIIIDDFHRDLYDSVYINFSYAISNDLLQKLARNIAKYNAFYKIRHVYQHHLNFISSTPNLFDLDIHDVYSKIRSKEEKPLYIEKIAQSLLSIIMTTRMLPNVFYQSGFAEEVAKRLEVLVTEAVTEHHNTRGAGYFQSQGMMVLANRDIDHTCVLMHPLHYGAQIDDIIKIKNNKVKLKSEANSNKHAVEEYDLDVSADKFWANKMNVPFYDVMGDLDKELHDWTSEYEKMGHKKETTKIEDMSSNIGNALDKVPEMAEKKKRIDMHTNLVTHLTNEIKDRSFDVYYEIESSLIFKKYLDSKERDEFAGLLTNTNSDSQKYINDRVRLLAIHLQSIADPPNKDVERVEQALQEIQDKVTPRIKKYLEERRLKPKSGGDEGNKDSTNIGLKMFRGLAQKVTTHSKGLLQSVGSFLSTGQVFTSVKLVTDIMDSKSYLQNDGVGQINLASKVDSQDLRKTNDIVVFIVDGGCLNEYQNFSELAKKYNGNIIYGSSYIYNAEQFLKEI